MPVILRTTTVKLKENLYVGDGKYASVAYEHKPGRRLVSGGGVIAVLSVTLLVSAAVSKRDGRILATVLPIGVAAVSGMVGYVVAWLLSDVFVVFGVGLGSRVMSWVAAGFAIAGFAIVHIVLSRGMMRVAAAILTVFAILAAAIGIDQSYGEYATIGSLFGEDSYCRSSAARTRSPRPR